MQCTLPLKLLHLSFHNGCIREIKYIARELGIELTSIFAQKDWVNDNNVEYMATCIDLTEWYCAEHKDWFIYFDSWQDLKVKIDTTNYGAARKKIRQYGADHNRTVLDQWSTLFDTINSKKLETT